MVGSQGATGANVGSGGPRAWQRRRRERTREASGVYSPIRPNSPPIYPNLPRAVRPGADPPTLLNSTMLVWTYVQCFIIHLGRNAI